VDLAAVAVAEMVLDIQVVQVPENILKMPQVQAVQILEAAQEVLTGLTPAMVALALSFFVGLQQQAHPLPQQATLR
jgi:hypothetical protein